MLSRFKNELSRIDPAPPPAFLEKIKLQKKEYAEVRKQQTTSTVRSKGALNVQVISNADNIVLQALQYIVSNRAQLRCIIDTDWAISIEIMKVAQFKTKLINKQDALGQDGVVCMTCQTRFGKRGNMKVKYNECRDRCFLAPYYSHRNCFKTNSI
jgi:hypothetical protein